jgi:hypothetical protein
MPVEFPDHGKISPGRHIIGNGISSTQSDARGFSDILHQIFYILGNFGFISAAGNIGVDPSEISNLFSVSRDPF